MTKKTTVCSCYSSLVLDARNPIHLHFLLERDHRQVVLVREVIEERVHLDPLRTNENLPPFLPYGSIVLPQHHRELLRGVSVNAVRGRGH